MQLLKDSGLNVVRLYVAWPGVEPSRGEYNMTYLQVIEITYVSIIYQKTDWSNLAWSMQCKCYTESTALVENS